MKPELYWHQRKLGWMPHTVDHQQIDPQQESYRYRSFHEWLPFTLRHAAQGGRRNGFLQATNTYAMHIKDSIRWDLWLLATGMAEDGRLKDSQLEKCREAYSSPSKLIMSWQLCGRMQACEQQFKWTIWLNELCITIDLLCLYSGYR